jgi:hypothetical protein
MSCPKLLPGNPRSWLTALRILFFSEGQCACEDRFLGPENERFKSDELIDEVNWAPWLGVGIDILVSVVKRILRMSFCWVGWGAIAGGVEGGQQESKRKEQLSIKKKTLSQ